MIANGRDVYGIQSVSRLTELSPHVIRIWERRYGAVTPGRSETQRRLYSDGDVERLTLLRRLTQAGHSIGNIAALPIGQLRDLWREADHESERGRSPAEGDPSQRNVNEALTAIANYDGKVLEEVLERVVVEQGFSKAIKTTIAPLIQRVGEAWAEGTLRVAHERMASTALETFIAAWCRPYAAATGAGCLVTATPTGQLHGLGALLAAAVARNVGWRVIHLGTGLPAQEIAAAARTNQASVLALSLVYPEHDPSLADELTHLRKAVPNDLTIVAGGRACPAYSEILSEARIIPLKSLDDLESFLVNATMPEFPEK